MITDDNLIYLDLTATEGYSGLYSVDPMHIKNARTPEFHEKKTNQLAELKHRFMCLTIKRNRLVRKCQ